MSCSRTAALTNVRFSCFVIIYRYISINYKVINIHSMPVGKRAPFRKAIEYVFGELAGCAAKAQASLQIGLGSIPALGTGTVVDRF